MVLAPFDRAAVFLGKATAVAVELLLLEVPILGLAAALFDLTSPSAPAVLLASLVLGIAGLAAVGSLFGVLAESPRAGQGLLPLLVLPLASPVLLAGVRATSLAASGRPGVGPWLGLLAAFDVSFLALGVLLFGALLEER